MIHKEHLPFEPHKLFWICPECGSVNAFSHEDAERFTKKTGEPCSVSHGSCFEDICGNCGRSIVAADSPILAPCYTHSED